MRNAIKTRSVEGCNFSSTQRFVAFPICDFTNIKFSEFIERAL